MWDNAPLGWQSAPSVLHGLFQSGFTILDCRFATNGSDAELHFTLLGSNSWGRWGWNNSCKCLGEEYMHSKIYTWITERTKLVSPIESWVFLGQSIPEVDAECLAAVCSPCCVWERNSKRRFQYPEFTLRCISLTPRMEQIQLSKL